MSCLPLLLALTSVNYLPQHPKVRVPGKQYPERLAVRSTLDPKYMQVACPKCGAQVAERCDRRTLGKHGQHQARIEAYSEMPSGTEESTP